MLESLFAVSHRGDYLVLEPRRDSQVRFLVHEPGIAHISTCESGISRIDESVGELFFRESPISQVAAQYTFEQTAELLIFGEVSTNGVNRIAPTEHFSVPPAVASMLAETTDPDPTQVLIAACAVLDGQIRNLPTRAEQASVMLGQLAGTVTALSRRRAGVAPKWESVNGKSIAESIVLALGQNKVTLDQRVALANLVLSLHADHEQNCSTTVVRAVASSGASLSAAMAAGVAAFSGPLHGGASNLVADQIAAIARDPSQIQILMDRAVDRKGKIFGLGHRVYRTWDPRAKIMYELIERSPQLNTPEALAAKALADACAREQYFVSRSIYPNPDLFNGVLFRAVGFAPGMNVAALCLSRAAGWLAHYFEHVDAHQPITRPRQLSTLA